jgi:hypothetical protein
MSTTVHVSNLSPKATESEVREFFSFCGKITSLSVTPVSKDPDSMKSATVTFEKETAAKTALLLDNTQFRDSTIKVEAGQSLDELASGKTTTSPDDKAGKDDGEIEQEDKPRSRILAEYMAHGYAIGDQALHRAIELDRSHGFSQRFTQALHNFDNRFHASDRARAVDASYGVMDRAQAGWRGLRSYFEKAIGTPTGQRLVAFYTNTERQVLDIHNEARRLAELRKQEQQQQGGGSGQDQPKVSQVPGTDKTGCGKSSISGKEAGHSATGPASDVAAATHLQPLGSNLTHEATGPAADITATTGVAPVGDNVAGKTG